MSPKTPDRGPDYGSEYDNQQFLKRKAREKNRLMKQFCKLEGECGNSREYRDGWERVFGKGKR